ncbi:MAG: glycosyltransferase family 39 protein, partial [Candidatus Andersenbacteria bacterium]
MIIAFLKRHKIDAYLALGLFVVALLPRIIGLGAFLTADEKNWIGRSFEFVRAFHDLRFNDMLQTTHPGVTTLWVSGLALTAKSMISHISFADMNLIYFVKTTQFSIAFLNSLAIPVIFIFLLLLLKNRFLAVLATLFIAFDPFIIGYSRVVHVDVLMGSFLTLAVLATMLYAKNLQRSWLVASAVLSILAILTKIPAIFIMPFMLVALVVYHPKKIVVWSFWKDRIRDASIWVLLGVVITLLIWPALLWVPNPAGNVLVLNRDITEAAATPHDSNEDYNLDITHYPYALLDRSNPVTLIGACIGIIGIVVLISKKKTPKELLLIFIYM